MCTVSFYKKQNTVIITSNRDEHINRLPALAPKSECINGRKLFFPIDAQKGGTWFIAIDNGDAFVLLNGAESKHVHNPPYKKSRGIILMQIASSLNFEDTWINIDLKDIEPFTIVAFVNGQLKQLRWDGKDKQSKILNDALPHIWSSSTLYTPEVIKQRENWFESFITKQKAPLSANDFIRFHTATELQDTYNGIIINRNGKMLTKNVTQYFLEGNDFKLLHIDLMDQSESTIVGQII